MALVPVIIELALPKTLSDALKNLAEVKPSEVSLSGLRELSL